MMRRERDADETLRTREGAAAGSSAGGGGNTGRWKFIQEQSVCVVCVLKALFEIEMRRQEQKICDVRAAGSPHISFLPPHLSSLVPLPLSVSALSASRSLPLPVPLTTRTSSRFCLSYCVLPPFDTGGNTYELGVHRLFTSVSCVPCNHTLQPALAVATGFGTCRVVKFQIRPH